MPDARDFAANLLEEIGKADNHAASQRYYDALRVALDAVEPSQLVNGLALIDALSAALAQAVAGGDEEFVQGAIAFFGTRLAWHINAIRAEGKGTLHVVVQ